MSVLGEQLEFYWNVHLWPRLAGLSDDELFWEPAPGAWSVRPGDDGVWRLDGLAVEPPVPPVTTIAWRLVHVARDVVGKRARALYWPESMPDVPADTSMYDDLWWSEPLPTTADEALAMLEQAYELWRTGVAGLDDAGLAAPLGPKAAPYAEQSVADHVAHINREVIAHGAEMCLLRDLYRARCNQSIPIVAAAFRGDEAEVRQLLTDGARVRETLMGEAAGLQHWGVVRALLDLGVDPNGGSPSTLHYAVAAGDVDLVRKLVEHGASLTVTDPTYGLTPAGWADFFGFTEIAEYLKR